MCQKATFAVFLGDTDSGVAPGYRSRRVAPTYRAMAGPWRRWVRWAGAGAHRATSGCITAAEAGGPSQSQAPTRPPRRPPLIAGNRLIYCESCNLLEHNRRTIRKNPGERSQPFHQNLLPGPPSTRRMLCGPRQWCRRSLCPSSKMSIRGVCRWGRCRARAGSIRSSDR